MVTETDCIKDADNIIHATNGLPFSVSESSIIGTIRAQNVAQVFVLCLLLNNMKRYFKSPCQLRLYQRVCLYCLSYYDQSTSVVQISIQFDLSLWDVYNFQQNTMDTDNKKATQTMPHQLPLFSFNSEDVAGASILTFLLYFCITLVLYFIVYVIYVIICRYNTTWLF